MFPLLTVVYLFVPTIFAADTLANETVLEIKNCEQLNLLLANMQEKPVCKCYAQGMSGVQLWLGCAGVNMPQLHEALNSFQDVIFIPGLKIWSSSIFALQDSFFSKIRVRTLVIEGSGLGKFKAEPFQPLALYLESLDLKDNSIQSLHTDMFRGLNKLKFLDLSRNKIEELNEDVFDSLQSLQVLSLHRNLISSIPKSIFSNLTNLRSLNLHSNELTIVKRGSFDGLSRLNRNLDLSKNGIIQVEDGAFNHLKNVEDLNLGENNLSHLVLNGLDSLISLKLNNNSIPTEKVLSFSNLPSLLSFYLDGNLLRVLGDSPELYKSMPNLKTLSASKNNIHSVHAENLPDTIEKLLLQYNSINQSPEHGWAPSSLIVLQLGHNHLSHVSTNDFAALIDVKTLGLGGNRIESIDEDALASNRLLERIYLNGNLLSSVPDKFVDALPPTLIATDWSDNPWSCSCLLARLAEWLKDHTDLLFSIQLTKTKCNGSNQPLTDMSAALARDCDGSNNTARPSTGPWLTAVAVVMGVASLLMIIAGVLLFLQNLLSQQPGSGDGRKGQVWPSRTVQGVRIYDLTRVPSDMVTLIPKAQTNNDTPQKKVHFEPNV